MTEYEERKQQKIAQITKLVLEIVMLKAKNDLESLVRLPALAKELNIIIACPIRNPEEEGGIVLELNRGQDD